MSTESKADQYPEAPDIRGDDDGDLNRSPYYPGGIDHLSVPPAGVSGESSDDDSSDEKSIDTVQNMVKAPSDEVWEKIAAAREKSRIGSAVITARNQSA